MANTIDWGKATQNNTNGFGKYQNTIDAGSIYADSYSGETVLIGTSAAFSYSKSSFHQDESDPTPTITGTTGGTFSATPSGLSINASTGTIDLSASTIQPYTITYTVDGVSANFSLSVTASPFLANTFSMLTDGIDDRIQLADGATHFTPNVPSATTGETEGSISFWFKLNNASSGGVKTLMSLTCGSLSGNNYILVKYNQASQAGRYIRIYLKGANATQTGDIITQSFIYDNSNTTWSGSGITWEQDVWYHLAYVYDASATNRVKIYINGNEFLLPNDTNASSTNGARTLSEVPYSLPYSKSTAAGTYPQINLGCARTGLTSYTEFWNGHLDEVATFTSALSSNEVQEIYNATANNTGKALDLNTDYNNYTSSSNLEIWNRLGD